MSPSHETGPTVNSFKLRALLSQISRTSGGDEAHVTVSLLPKHAEVRLARLTFLSPQVPSRGPFRAEWRCLSFFLHPGLPETLGRLSTPASAGALPVPGLPAMSRLV